MNHLIGPDEIEKIALFKQNGSVFPVVPSAHARLSPSSAHRWMACAASVVLERGLPDTSSEHADEGTAAHELASRCLTERKDAGDFIGTTIIAGEREFIVDDEMAEAIQRYVDAVRERVRGYQLAGASVELRVEQRVDFSDVIGVPDSFGTADVQIIATWPDHTVTIETDDLKYGRGVKVDAEHNHQLMLYNTGLYAEVSIVADVREVVQVIHQPRLDHITRLDHISEWSCTVEDLLQFAAEAGEAAGHATNLCETGDVERVDFNPGEKQCRWCKAKATCPALARQVQDTVGAEFDAMTDSAADGGVLVGDVVVKGVANASDTDLATKMSAVDLIEQWCKAVRAEVERRLLAGVPVPGYKIVEGRKGSRKWSDEKEAETALKAMRLKLEEMYDLSLISPPSAEKLHKSGVIGPRQWPKLQALITQSEGKPSVAPESDKRPAIVITPTADEFESLV